ncbi:hypothetical protein EVAR_50676_1 [Eumeta japonica]|uniref:Uncharacterized protein n=1 Tax=Eumeta variegata TaxID=151549 RepID=A0A4C1XPR1_EUMVA|nr:hypothetical protein EVAR_50676_1 [Eumeta japonica]
MPISDTKSRYKNYARTRDPQQLLRHTVPLLISITIENGESGLAKTQTLDPLGPPSCDFCTVLCHQNLLLHILPHRRLTTAKDTFVRGEHDSLVKCVGFDPYDGPVDHDFFTSVKSKHSLLFRSPPRGAGPARAGLQLQDSRSVIEDRGRVWLGIGTIATLTRTYLGPCDTCDNILEVRGQSRNIRSCRDRETPTDSKLAHHDSRAAAASPGAAARRRRGGR